MGKKQQRNAFWFFMKEEEPKLRREGRVFPNGMADMVVVCHPRYKALPQKEKDRFENMAKQYKARMRGVEGDKVRLDNQGDVVAYRSNKYTDLEKRRMQEKKIMKKNWPEGIELAKEKFYFVSFQILCETEDGHFLPCEIAIIEYSIEQGITKNLHRFIEPGRIPTGYRFTCIEHSQDTHQIPVENFDQADSNYLGLWNQIENFINPNGENPEYPPLYCLSAGENYRLVEYCLEWIQVHACTGRPNRIKHIFSIEDLFQELLANIGKTASRASCITALSTSNYDYEPNTKCNYHEELEVKDCSLGIVNRYGYAISEVCARPDHYDIELTKRHIPMREDDPESLMNVRLPSSMPPFKNQPIRNPPMSNMATKPPPRRQVVEEDDEEEEYLDLRLPKTQGHYGGVEKSQNFAWGGAMGGPSDLNLPPAGRGQTVQYDDDFPAVGGGGGGAFNGYTPAPMGRGLTQAFQGMNVSDRHAGKSGPPPPTAAPDPPVSWKQQPVNVGFQQPMGIGRGMMVNGTGSQTQPRGPPGFTGGNSGISEPPGLPSRNGPISQPPGFHGKQDSSRVPDDYAPLRLPGQSAPTNNVEVLYDRTAIPIRPDEVVYDRKAGTAPAPAHVPAPTLQLGRGSGSGHGGILEGILEGGWPRPGKTMGRGYAPLDWVDDGTLGPMKR